MINIFLTITFVQIVNTSEDGNTEIQVNLDPDLQLQLREITYLSSAPINLEIREEILLRIRNIDTRLTQSLAARLTMVTAQYNKVAYSDPSINIFHDFVPNQLFCLFS